ncbi:hypothetical protein ABPG74_020872 [Tetrahymena malaccensis]
MSTTKVAAMNDIVNVNNIKSSKLFKKFLETEQSEDNTYLRSGENTNRGFQESPFKKQPEFPEKDLENILRTSQIRNGQSRNSFNPYYDNNLNISQTSEQSNINTQSAFLQLQHSYFQPPTPQYLASNDLTQSPNLSQQLLDNHKKQSMSPERFYFNPPAVPLNNNQTIIEDDQEMQQHSEPSQNQLQSNNNISRQPSYAKQPFNKINSSLKQTPQQQNYYDQSPPVQFVQSCEYIPPMAQNQNYNDQVDNQRYLYNSNQRGFQPNQSSQKKSLSQSKIQGNLQNNQYAQVQYQNDEIQYPMRREDLNDNSRQAGEQQMDYDPDQEGGQRRRIENVKNTSHNYQNVDYFDDTSSNHNRNTEKKNLNNNNNLFKNSKSNLMNMSHETKNFEKDLKQFQHQIQLQEEQIFQIQINLEKEQLKNRTLDETIADLRRKIDSLEIEKTEIRSKLLLETEKNVRELQQQTSQANNFKSKVTELEKREEQLRADIDKAKQALYKEESNKHKLEDEIRDYKNKITELTETSQEYQRRQERRDDEIIQLKLQNEQLKAKMASVHLNNERNTERLTETQRQQFRDVEEREENLRKISEMQQKIQNYLIESERLKNENYNLNRQLHDSNFRNEILQNDLFNQKQMLLEKNQKENILQVNIDKANLEIHQLRNLLSRTELELRDVKEHNNHLIRNLTDIASQKALSETHTEQGQYSKAYFVPSASFVPNPASEQPNLTSNTIPSYKMRGGLDPQTPPKSRSLVNLQKPEDTTQKLQVQTYKRGRMANELEQFEEEKTTSPGRLRFKPKDHNIFGTEDNSRFQTRHNQDYSWSPAKKVEMQKPRDHNIFGQPADDTYQRNPTKIGHSSLSPQRTNRNPWDDMPPAGMRKRSPRNNPILGNTNGFDNVVESGVKYQAEKSDVATLEENLMLMNQDRGLLEAELRKVEDMKRKSGADLRRKAEINKELQQLEQSIQQHKLQLRQLGVF